MIPGMIHALQTLVLASFAILVIVAALRDVTSYTIPNGLSLALIGGFPVAALSLGLPLQVVGLHVAVGVAALVAGMVMFALRWIGGGDAKLFAAAALWLGLPAILTYLAVTALAGGGLAVLLLALRSSHVRPFVPNGPAWFGRLAEPGENVPYGVAIAAGALAAFPLSPLMIHFGN
jgi:prepilin peptidase CpaA